MLDQDLAKFISTFEAEGFVCREDHKQKGYAFETMAKNIKFRNQDNILYISKRTSSKYICFKICEKRDPINYAMLTNSCSFYLKDFDKDIEFLAKHLDSILDKLSKGETVGCFSRRVELDNEILLISQRMVFSSARGFIESYDEGFVE